MTDTKINTSKRQKLDPADPPEDWRVTAARAQQRVVDSIPKQWIMPPSTKAKHTGDARSFALDCGILTPRQISITSLDATALLHQIHTGELTAAEATEAFCARAAIAHQLVNCLTEFTPEAAIAEARLLDEEFSRTGEVRGPLHGLPMAVKDIMHVRGSRVTMAWVAWAEREVSGFDASPVRVMREAGAVVFGRTAMPQTGMALETTSNLWGRTLNPFNKNFGAGGSSGGDAALCAMRGEPAAPITTDIGGSIRAPGAFNGLYAMRPTADRVPKNGLITAAPGNLSIKVSVGPCVHSMQDLKLFTKLILTHPTLPYEPTTILPYWTEVPAPTRRLRVAVISTDGVVDPHPPIKRALLETSAQLRAAGHEVVEFQKPFDFWAAALVTWALYFQTGAREHHDFLALSNEPPIPQFAYNHGTFKIKELTVPELFELNGQQAAFKLAFQEAFDAQQIDVILCPCAPMVGVPHDFPLWWGYTTVWNMLDYPSVVMPVKNFTINAAQDAKDGSYEPRENPFDGRNWELYDPELWKTQPMTLQIVGRPYRDEALIANCELLDEIVNGKRE